MGIDDVETERHRNWMAIPRELRKERVDCKRPHPLSRRNGGMAYNCDDHPRFKNDQVDAAAL